jgi:PTS system mannose-specific IIA component
MSKKYLTFIVAHEDVAQALLDGVQRIIGEQKNTYTFSNKEESLPIIVQKMEKFVSESLSDLIVCFTDLKGGSCWTVANMVRKKYPQMVVISGVNLPMLITYFNNSSNLEFTKLIDKTVSDACRGIQIQSN